MDENFRLNTECVGARFGKVEPRDDKAPHFADQPYLLTLKAGLWGGLVAGSLDCMDAVISVWLRGITTMRLFQYIASGLLGVRAFRGGWATAVLGCAIHFTIAIGAATVYCAFSRRLRLLVRRPVICGLGFGIAVYVVMHYIVLPLSATPAQPPPTFAWVVNQLFSHTVLVGLPIALLNRRVLSTMLKTVPMP